MTNRKESVIARISQSGNLPTLPEILVKLIDACEDESRPLSEIADIICKDPVLSFKVLQLVNSAYYSIRKTFTNIEQAVIFLGANSVKNIVVTTAIHQVFENRRFKKVKRFNIREFWWHSLLCATLSKRIAHKVGFTNFDEAYLSGLLHDIGRIVLVSTYPKEHDSILLDTEDEQNMLWAETQLIGATHCEVGAWLVHKWQLASLMAEAIRQHHAPIEQIEESFPLVKIVYLSNLLSYENVDATKISKTSETLLGLGAAELNSIMAGVSEEVEDIAKGLDISIQRPAQFADQDTEESDKEEKAADAEVDLASTELIQTDTGFHNKPSAQQELTSRIRNISLLTGFLENLTQAGDSDRVIYAFEQCVNVLLDIDKVLFFLPDQHQVLLKGAASSSSLYNQISQDLTLPLQSSSSKIVYAYWERSLTYLTTADKLLSSADLQALTVLEQQTILLLPISAENKPAGIILLGLPDGAQSIARSDCKLLQVIAGQVGLSLHLEKMKAQQKAEIETERIAAVSMTAKKFAHEINNPLGIISNYLTSLKLKLSSETNIQEDLAVINEEIKRISSMVNQLDLFSQPVASKIQTIDLNNVLEDIIHIVKTSLFDKAGTIISFRPHPSLPPLQSSRDAIKQIMINIVKNASEAMPDGGRIDIATSLVGAESGNNSGVEIVIRDNGPGLPESIEKNLFKPFSTTKGEGHSGLGLSIVHKAVSILGGKITCKSKQSEGTTFTVFLPLENP